MQAIFAPFTTIIDLLTTYFLYLEQFHKCSSFQFNTEKTEILKVGHQKDTTTKPIEQNINQQVDVFDTINILGTFVGCN